MSSPDGTRENRTASLRIGLLGFVRSLRVSPRHDGVSDAFSANGRNGRDPLPNRTAGNRADAAPGDQPPEGDATGGLGSYAIGFALAALLTAGSFYLSTTTLVWGPSISVALVVLAIAQIGVHLVFFLHITTAPDNTNNIMALAFGALIVLLVIGGSLWIMANLNHNMMPMDELMKMQR